MDPTKTGVNSDALEGYSVPVPLVQKDRQYNGQSEAVSRRTDSTMAYQKL